MKALDNALHDKLTGDIGAGGINTLLGGIVGQATPKGRIYRAVCGTDPAIYPFLVYQLMASSDLYTLTGRHNEEIVYLIKAVDQGKSAAGANTIAERLDALLTDQSLPAAGAVVLNVRRAGRIEYLEQDGDQYYIHVGGLWRMMI